MRRQQQLKRRRLWKTPPGGRCARREIPSGDRKVQSGSPAGPHHGLRLEHFGPQDHLAGIALESAPHLCTFENGCTANLRGSGTEPKLKYYVELHGSDRDKVRRLRVSVGWGCGRDGCACMSRTCVFRGDLCLVSCMSRTCVLCDLCLVRETRKTQ